MSSPILTDGSRNFQFRKRVPADLRDKARGKLVVLEFPQMKSARPRTISASVGETVKFSLGTTDETVAKIRMGLATTHVEKFFETLRTGPSGTSHKQLVALSGEVYRLFVEKFAEDPGSPDTWAAFKAFNRAAREGRLAIVPEITNSLPDERHYASVVFGGHLTEGVNRYPTANDSSGLEARFGWLTNWVLTTHGISIDAETRKRLLIQVDQASTDAAWALKRNAAGDYTPDSKASRFPPIQARQRITIDDLFERWKAERGPTQSTVATWDKVRRSLKEHMGHDLADRVSDVDIIAWKDKLVTGGLSAKSINDSYLAGARTFFQYAVDNRLIPTNPVSGIKVLGAKKAGESMLPYSNDEVGKLLAIAKANASPERRWMIWLAATSGARIGEIAQLWGDCIGLEDDHPIMDIKPAPDGGTLKNAGSERKIPLHSTIIREGFLEFVAAKGKGPLFYGRSSGNAKKRHASKGATNHLATWIRSNGFTDPRKAPNHALRHWWKTAAMEADVADSIADAIQGHVGRTEADGYRHTSVSLLARAIAKVSIPFPVNAEGDRPVATPAFAAVIL